MKKVVMFLVVSSFLILWAATAALAVPFANLTVGQEITINDTIKNSETWSSSNRWLGPWQEDNETEKTYNGTNTIAGQEWDFEGMFWNASLKQLTVIAGIPLQTGTAYGGFQEVGDLFVGHWNGVYNNPPNPANQYVADYALKFERDATVGALNDGDTYKALKTSGSWNLYSGFTTVAVSDTAPPGNPFMVNTTSGSSIGSGTYTTGAVEGTPFAGYGSNYTHYYLQISGLDEQSWLFNGPEDILHLTIQCGNDVIRGSAVPEPATMLLLGSGLIGLAGFSRKKFPKK